MGKLGEELKFKYEPIWPQAKTDEKFHFYDYDEEGNRILKIHEENFKLVENIEELKTYIDKCKDKVVGFDTETTGLSYNKDHIVGFSLSLDRYSGIYVPIRHQKRLEIINMIPKLDKEGNPVISKAGVASVKKEVTYQYENYENNIDPKEALDTLYQILLGAKRVLAHNSEFDINMLKFEGYDIMPIKFFDTLILPYLFDPEATGLANLKALEKRVLGRTVPEFKDVLGKSLDHFGLVDPHEGFVYACCDTSGLIGVYEEMFPVVASLLRKFKNVLEFNGVPYNVLVKDNQMVKAFADYYGHAKILINRKKAQQYKKDLEESRKKVVEKIYTYFDQGLFNLSASSKEFKQVMASKNVFTGIKTDKGGHSWSKKATGEMKRNIGKLRECILNWKNFSFTNSKLSKKGSGFQLATLLEMYGEPYFNMKATINDLAITSKDGSKIDLKEFWISVKHMYKEEVEKIHILDLIQKNNSLNKALNSYVDKLTQVDECFMKYRLKGTKSGRLSSGNGAKSDKRRNQYYIDLNAQNLTKPASAYYKAEKCPEDEESILGWKFTPLDKDYALQHLEDLYIVEGQDPGITIRGCIEAPQGEIKYSYIPEENGKEEKEVYEIELEDGTTITCCEDTVFKVLCQNKELLMPLHDIMKRNDVEIIR